jgi:hypothetical protein
VPATLNTSSGDSLRRICVMQLSSKSSRNVRCTYDTKRQRQQGEHVLPAQLTLDVLCGTQLFADSDVQGADACTCSCVKRAMTQVAGRRHARCGYNQLTGVQSHSKPKSHQRDRSRWLQGSKRMTVCKREQRKCIRRSINLHHAARRHMPARKPCSRCFTASTFELSPASC